MNHWKKDRIIKDNNDDGDAGDPSVETIAIRITIQHPLDDGLQNFNGDDDNDDNNDERRNDTKQPNM